MRGRLSKLLLASALTLGLAAPTAGPALALPDNGIDQQIRPNFGGLITPPLKPRYRPDRWKPGRYRWGKRPSRPGSWRPPAGCPYPGDYGSGGGYSSGGGYPPANGGSQGGGYPPDDQYAGAAPNGQSNGQSNGKTNGSGGYTNGNGSGGGYPPSSGSGGYDDGYGGGYGGGSGGYDDCGYYRDQQVAIVDCGDSQAGPTPISDALRTLVDNGVLYIRGSQACRETVIIERSVVIAGEGTSVFDGEGGRRATIAPRDGASCIRIAAGVRRVELRDLNLTTEKGGRSPCVESWDAEVALVRTNVTYWGDSSAVFASGGRLIIHDSVIDGRTWDAAVAADGAVVEIRRSRISGESAGLDLTPGNGESVLEGVGVVSRGGEQPGDIGILVRGLRGGTGTLSLKNVRISGWRTGLHLERGAQVEVSRSRISNAQRGIITGGANLTVRESAIHSTELSAYISSGRATFQRNRFWGDGRMPYPEPGAILELEDNWYYSSIDCWRQRLGKGVYCVSGLGLPESLRDDRWNSPWRGGWDDDGYDRGYQRDGAPGFVPPAQPPPPAKRRWGKRG